MTNPFPGSDSAWTTGRPFSPDSLRHEPWKPSRKPGSGDIQVAVHAFALNPVDYRLSRSLPLPLIGRRPVASDFAGVVESVGHAVQHLQPGDRVFGMLSALRGGVAADRIVLPSHCVQKAPESIPLVEAAAIPLAGLTALQALRDLAEVKAGQRVLIHGATGGVGCFAIQIAKILGCDVRVTCSPHNFDFAHELGASECINYHEEDFTSGLEKVDGVFDVRGNRRLSDAARIVRPGGWVVSTEPRISTLAGELLNPFREVTCKAVIVRSNPPDLEWLAKAVDNHSLRVVIAQVYPRDGVPEAYRALMQKRTRGKRVVSMKE